MPFQIILCFEMFSSVDELGPNLGLYYADGCRCSHFGWFFKAGMSIISSAGAALIDRCAGE